MSKKIYSSLLLALAFCATAAMAISRPSGAAAPASPQAAAPDLASWALYRRRFVTPDGRVADTGNGGISHSEGQSYAMLLALHHGDRPTFERVWAWTQAHLRARGDRLFAWKWVPGQGVADTNDAADGDLVVAWALLRAAERWKVPAWKAEAEAIAADVLAKLYRAEGERSYLLPGAEGFAHREGDVVNPSYLVFPAYDALAGATGRPEWGLLATSGSQLLRQARFGRWGLPADWLQLAAPVRPAPGFAPRFGYDAIRVPLFVMWGGREDLLAPFKAYWSAPEVRQAMPGWTDVQDGSSAPYRGSPGQQAVAAATLAYPRLQGLKLPALDERQDYYSSSLLMLTHMMVQERVAR